jgi:transposase
MHEEESSAEKLVPYETKIATLERKVGQLMMEVDLLKKTPRLKVVNSSATSSIVSEPRQVAPSEGVSSK